MFLIFGVDSNFYLILYSLCWEVNTTSRTGLLTLKSLRFLSISSFSFRFLKIFPLDNRLWDECDFILVFSTYLRNHYIVFVLQEFLIRSTLCISLLIFILLYAISHSPVFPILACFMNFLLVFQFQWFINVFSKCLCVFIFLWVFLLLFNFSCYIVLSWVLGLVVWCVLFLAFIYFMKFLIIFCPIALL